MNKITLEELRYITRLTQLAVADKMGNQQSTVSDMERAFPLNCRLSTLRRYIDAIGGELTISIKLDKETYILTHE